VNVIVFETLVLGLCETFASVLFEPIPSKSLFMSFREERVTIKGRSDADSFPLFRAYEHPLSSTNADRVFVIFMDTREASMKKLYEWEKSLRIPYFKEEDLVAKGELARWCR
jgi:hypothetical protein